MLLLLQMMKRMLKENQIQTKREILCLLCWGGGVCVCLFTQKRSFDKASLFTWNYSRKSKVFRQILYNNIIILISAINN